MSKTQNKHNEKFSPFIDNQYSESMYFYTVTRQQIVSSLAIKKNSFDYNH